ncbi:MAG: porin [Candidatus Eisenbacteria bacterium]|uniref:Porin n=1 Tax=Eiseniibacteriota bacterium TaxID=2212470 RepID=A0A7Y2E7U2_UNCEI|nr:porin [Candidatus Eisenbacteria bacterium]
MMALSFGFGQSEAGSGSVAWNSGLQFKSEDGAEKVKLGGRIMNDWAWLDGDDDVEAALGVLEDGTEFRRVRMFLSGQIYSNVLFKAQLDFAGGSASFKDVYLGLKGVPGLGTLKVGQQHEPFGLEELTSSNHSMFMERPLLNDAFAPSRHTGISASNTAQEDRMTWAAGVFRNTGSTGMGTGDGEYNVTARVTGLPVYSEKGKSLVHVGVAASHSAPSGDEVKFRARPESHLAPRFADTGDIASNAVNLLGFEGAVVQGPISVQGEFVNAQVNQLGGEDLAFNGFYVEASFFVTGEHRAYKKSSGKFGRVKPEENFSSDGGSGALELAARFSSLDLDDNNIEGGILDSISGGVNWYLNPNTRVMLNYVMAEVEDGGTAHIGQTRFQVDF